jgi:hypothetical protein
MKKYNVYALAMIIFALIVQIITVLQHNAKFIAMFVEDTIMVVAMELNKKIIYL